MKNRRPLVSATSALPQISVALASYNGEKHIREQLDSIARQTLLPLELVITDDGSTDATLRIVEDFARAAPFPVRWFQNDINLGYAGNFLKAASLCTGDVIAFCDQDDIWLENKLSKCAGCFRDSEVMLAAHSALTIFESGQSGHIFPRFPRTRIADLGSVDPFVYPHGFATVVRRDLVQIRPGPHRPAELQAHDQWFWFLAATTGKIAMIADVLVLYRQHGNNLYGALQPPTALQRFRRAARTLRLVNFDALAETELACSRILHTVGEHRPDLKDRIERSAKKLEFRSRIHRMRSRLYGGDSNAWGRTLIFCRILLSGGYFPGALGSRLGVWRGLKDVLLGVIGAYKLFAFAGAADLGKEAK